LEGMSIRAIARRYHHGREAIRRAIADPAPPEYTLREPRPKPRLDDFLPRIDELLDESDQLPRKQRYTAKKIFQLIQGEGYQGSESTVRRYVGQLRKRRRPAQAFLPLSFDPGQDAQVDWGEAKVDFSDERLDIQIFVMRLNYSKARFVMAFPFQRQEAFFAGHNAAFRFFEGVPRRITYDNLKTAVYKVLSGRNRQEQQAFITFRSHYLFDSHYCTPGQAHEKGGVENDIGYAQRNFLSPIPQVSSYADLNAHLRATCQRDMERRLRGQDRPVSDLWAQEKPLLLPLPPSDFPACINRPVKVNPYSQVIFETNRYSVPTEYVDRQLVLRAYPFEVEILALDHVVARHPRCLSREQDVFDPLHYLGLLVQRPGAFEHAAPLRRWRQEWPPVYERLLAAMTARWPEGRGLREFLAILKLHRQHAPEALEAAIREALASGAIHLDGVQLCLRQQSAAPLSPTPLDLAQHPRLQGIGHQPVDVGQYNQLLAAG
jgi:transposase